MNATGLEWWIVESHRSCRIILIIVLLRYLASYWTWYVSCMLYIVYFLWNNNQKTALRLRGLNIIRKMAYVINQRETRYFWFSKLSCISSCTPVALRSKFTLSIQTVPRFHSFYINPVYISCMTSMFVYSINQYIHYVATT
jgi:hypothetical protein